MRQSRFTQQAEDYKRIEKVIQFIDQNFRSQPTLDEIAKSAYLSKYYFQRSLKRWVGISPTQFVQFLTLDYAKHKLNESKSIFSASLDSGLSGPSRLHDLFVKYEAISPGEYKKQGSGLKIEYGYHPSPFGTALIAMTTRGICHLSFVEPGHRRVALSDLMQDWPGAKLIENKNSTRNIIEQFFSSDYLQKKKPFHLYLKGTNFQINVWKALLTIPPGQMISYKGVASYIGAPNSTRAVASAVAKNRIAYIIPCHRVIAQSGQIHRYRYGTVRKKAMLGWEAARTTINP